MSGLRCYTLLVKAQDAEREFHVSYEVVAPDEMMAARLAFADVARRGEEVLDVEHAEVGAVANPLAQPGVRFRSGRGFYEAA